MKYEFYVHMIQFDYSKNHSKIARGATLNDLDLIYTPAKELKRLDEPKLPGLGDVLLGVSPSGALELLETNFDSSD